MAKATREDILKHAVKKDGTTPSATAIDDVIKHKKDNPEWKGECSDLVGRPSSLTEEQKKKVVRLVFQKRGAARVTVTYCKQLLLFLRKARSLRDSRARFA